MNELGWIRASTGVVRDVKMVGMVSASTGWPLDSGIDKYKTATNHEARIGASCSGRPPVISASAAHIRSTDGDVVRVRHIDVTSDIYGICWIDSKSDRTASRATPRLRPTGIRAYIDCAGIPRDGDVGARLNGREVPSPSKLYCIIGSQQRSGPQHRSGQKGRNIDCRCQGSPHSSHNNVQSLYTSVREFLHCRNSRIGIRYPRKGHGVVQHILAGSVVAVVMAFKNEQDQQR